MRRREFIAIAGGAAAWPLTARSQQSAPLRVGTVSAQAPSAPSFAAFLKRMSELGYQEGTNFTFEFVQVKGAEEYKRGYDELAARKLDIVLAVGPEVALKSALAVTAAEPRPIVMVAIDYDPFALGYVNSLARPGGRVTGVSFQQIELTAKRLQVARDAFPDRPAATVFWDRISADQWQVMQNAASTFGLRLAGVELRDEPYDYEHALAQTPFEHRSFLLVTVSLGFFRDRGQLAALARRHRAASMFGFREWVDAGGLLSYGTSVSGLFRRAADYVDKVAKGAKPADLPIEQPTTFELVVNLKTAKAIGIELPNSILLRADEVIE